MSLQENASSVTSTSSTSCDNPSSHDSISCFMMVTVPHQSFLECFLLVCALWFQRDSLWLMRRLQARNQLHWLPLPGSPWLVPDSQPVESTPASPEGQVKYQFVIQIQCQKKKNSLNWYISASARKSLTNFIYSGFLTITPPHSLTSKSCFLPAATGRAAQSPSVLSGWCRPGSADWSLGYAAQDTAYAGPPESHEKFSLTCENVLTMINNWAWKLIDYIFDYHAT